MMDAAVVGAEQACRRSEPAVASSAVAVRISPKERTVMPSAAEINKINQKNLKRLDNGGKTSFLYWREKSGGGVVLIGDGHDAALLSKVANNKNVVRGTVTITKGTLTDPGTLKFIGNIANRRELEDALKPITKKKVLYA
jgi:hypothetical protein